MTEEEGACSPQPFYEQLGGNNAAARTEGKAKVFQIIL